MASRHLGREAVGHTLDTTALVHEASLGLLGGNVPDWRGRAQFFAFMSMVMRHVLVDHARRRRADKREGERVRVDLHPEMAGRHADPVALLDLEAALTRLGAHAPRMAKVAECRLFGGMNDGEIGKALDLSERTAAREWQRAKAWLRVALEEGYAGGTEHP